MGKYDRFLEDEMSLSVLEEENESLKEKNFELKEENRRMKSYIKSLKEKLKKQEVLEENGIRA